MANNENGDRILRSDEKVPHNMPSGHVSPFRRRAKRLLNALTVATEPRHWRPYSNNPEELRYPAIIFVWVRWLVYAASLVELIYRPRFSLETHVPYVSFLVFVVSVNAVVHYRLSTGRTVTLRWMLTLVLVDVILITGGTVVGGGFEHYFFYLLYYPALAWFAVFITSYRVTFAWVTMVAVVYSISSIVVGSGLDLEARDEKTLFARIVVMYAVVASVNLVARAESRRRQTAVRRERELQRDRIELAQAIHDTTAQSVFMIGIGIDSAVELAKSSDRELVAKLAATAALAKAAMWELRHPIDTGLIFEGGSLGRVLRLHASTFETITSISTAVVQTGTEPPLPSATRSRLFSIAHNALTNALRHSGARYVSIGLDFRDDGLGMSVSDDGVGLPDDYAERGRGFAYMVANAERVNGRLHVESGKSGRGTTVICAIEYDST